MKSFTFIVSIIVCFFRLPAEEKSYDIGGYGSYLFSRASMPSHTAMIDHLLHARLNGKWYPTESVSAILEYRFRGYYGNTVEQTPDFAGQLRNLSRLEDLGTVFWTGKQTTGYGEIDRLYISYAPDRWQMTIGRQRIAWGTNLVWNVIDIFNPLSILDFDYEERPAVDAVQVQYFTGEVSKIAAAIKPGSSTSPSTAALLWTGNRWNYDFHLIAGHRSDRWFVGGAWSGDIEGGGFRGEFLSSEISDPISGNKMNKLNTSIALSGDYTFPNSFYIHTETLYNSQGVTHGAAFYRPRALQLGLLSPSRMSLFQEFSYNISPLVRGSVFGIVNLYDASSVIVPSVTWSVLTNLDVMAIGLFFSGTSDAEYGGSGNAVYVRTRMAF
jgi:hypothetical protein